MLEGSRFKPTSWTFILFAVSVIGVGVYLYLDRHDALSDVIRSWGAIGIVLSILFMALVSITPMPSDALLVLYMKMYGAWWGVLYGWTGAVLSSFVVYALARNLGRPLFQSLITPARFEQVDAWIRRHGVWGLLFARLLPIPGFVVSYIVGTMPSVRLWPYVWTAAVSVLPYFVGAALIFLGVLEGFVWWVLIGVIAVGVFWGFGYWLRRRGNREKMRGD
ncbi:MAG: VTT domain-containing protein [Alicyclobacillus macrosporangiidus]|uniref:TVP38/TMEM64 family protein n=1 Tax=Alicyclobacillus macrosporangiidus TaxID=392015 RepID=UPI0026F08E66|nr:VTT domain-containing protein [Alicyclobacillus macrosporangiidus]MCL6598865.1 VTT domain-containing protein [Alicyclobacillus macrosporangiidus]